MNNKGVSSFSDVANFIKIFVSLGFVFVFAFLVVSNFDTQVQATNDSIIPEEAKVGSANAKASFLIWDKFFAGLLMAFIIVSVYLARKKQDINPVEVLVGIAMMFIFGFAGIIIENMWSGLTSNSLISDVTNQLTFLPFFLDNFIIILISYVAIVIIALATRDGGVSFGG